VGDGKQWKKGETKDWRRQFTSTTPQNTKRRKKKNNNPPNQNPKKKQLQFKGASKGDRRNKYHRDRWEGNEKLGGL